MRLTAVLLLLLGVAFAAPGENILEKRGCVSESDPMPVLSFQHDHVLRMFTHSDVSQTATRTAANL